jgi:hypothetical protein
MRKEVKLGQIGRVVAPRRPAGAGAGHGEGRVEREPGFDGGTRLVNPISRACESASNFDPAQAER